MGSRRGAWCRQEPAWIACNTADGAYQARVTHPFHPLHGQVLEVSDRRRLQDGERIYLEVAPGRTVWLPSSWTSLGPKDPWIVWSEGRALFRFDDLLQLAELVEQLRSMGGGDGV